MSKAIQSYYKVLADTSGDSATMIIYSYIGEQWEYDYEKYEYKKTGITATEFVNELNTLADKYAVINLRLHGPGGDIMHGAPMLTAIQNCKAKVVTWNDGICASMAADIWMMGHERRMAKNAMLMIHAPWSVCAGNAKDLRAQADILDKMSEAIIIATASATGKTEEEVNSAFYADYADHWLSYKDVDAAGLLTTGEEYAAAELPEKVEKMSQVQLLKYFEQKEQPGQPGLIERAQAAFVATIQKVVGTKSLSINQPNSPDMNLDELQKSLTDGTLSVADVRKTLDALTPPVAEEVPAKEAPAAVDPVAAKLVTMETEMAAMRKTLAEYGQLPGAKKAAPVTPETDLPGEELEDDEELAAFNKKMVQAAKTGESVRFTL